MLFFLGMVYVIGGIICSIIVIAACVVHSRSSHNAPKMSTAHMRYQPASVSERRHSERRNAPDADETFVGHPA